MTEGAALDPGSQKWHLDRRIQVATILAILTFVVGAVVGYVRLSDQVSRSATSLEMTAGKEDLARLRHQLEAFVASVPDNKDLQRVQNDVDSIRARQSRRDAEFERMSASLSAQSELLARLDERFVAIMAQLEKMDAKMDARITRP